MIHHLTWNRSYMLIWCSRNISYYYPSWKQLCCLIFLWKLWYIWSEFFRSKEQHLFKIDIFCYNVKVFHFNQFNASLLNKSINFFAEKKKLLNDSVHAYTFKQTVRWYRPNCIFIFFVGLCLIFAMQTEPINHRMRCVTSYVCLKEPSQVILISWLFTLVSY